MIAHVSVPSRTPRETALFFAAVIDGVAFDFPVVPGASIAVAKDGSGLAIEVYPVEMAHHPGAGEPDPSAVPSGPATLPWEVQILPRADLSRRSSCHVALGSKLTEEEILARARAAGWRAVKCDRAGFFRLVEVWIDGDFLVEILPPRELERYRAFMNPAGCSGLFGPSYSQDAVRTAA